MKAEGSSLFENLLYTQHFNLSILTVKLSPIFLHLQCATQAANSFNFKVLVVVVNIEDTACSRQINRTFRRGLCLKEEQEVTLLNV